MSTPFPTEALKKGNPRSSGFERNGNDWYVEPPRAVTALLDVEPFSGSIHDPACGGGNIPKVAASRGYVATGSDIVDRGFGDGVQDFLADSRNYDNIVSNPPFGIATEFTLHALALVKPFGKVAILQRLAWLEGRNRHASLFSAGCLHHVWVFSNRISMPPGGQSVTAKNGSVAFAWFVFQKERSGGTRLGWLP